ncbi:hypothetical protein [Streptomyces roseus]|uniref:hypothetical protein n=1 Tax=Streptomyces roseus TaxID=66430 RepID=UPI001ADEE595|nr:hypothetical protein [Streptomyces roseus]
MPLLVLGREEGQGVGDLLAAGGLPADEPLVDSGDLHDRAAAGQAVTLLRQHLAEGAFATRDRAFVTAHLAGALAAAGQSDDAEATGRSALQLAAVPGLGQALGELRRPAAALRPYARRPAVTSAFHSD